MSVETESGLGVKVPTFEGPLELLLNLIKQHEINIYDIPIALITRQYLDALDLMRSLNLSIAGDFLVMAATLIHIKSKTLLPVHEAEEDEEDVVMEDPRQELVERLLEYQKFKDVAGELESRESVWRQIFYRAPTELEETTEELVTGELTPFDLLDALQKVISRLKDPTGLMISNEDLSVRDQINFILSKIEQSRSILFEQLFEGMETRYAVVVTFLALLEVVRLGLIQIIQTEICSPIRLQGTDNFLKKEGDNGRS